MIGNQKKLVDVKKVLVVGSGGLSIGQAGEFDYSGESGEVESPAFPPDYRSAEVFNRN